MAEVEADPRGVVVVGSSGHAKVCLELLWAMGETVSFCVGGPGSEQDCLGVPVLEGDEHLDRLADSGFARAFIAVGDNSLRQRLASYATSLGYELVNAVSPRASISPSARLGCGVAVMDGAIINASSVIGDVAIVNTGATIDHDCDVAVAAHVAPQSGLAGNVSIGERAFVGIGCSVVPHQTIGVDAIVGAGSVVLRSVPDGRTAVGVPARLLPHTAR